MKRASTLLGASAIEHEGRTIYPCAKVDTILDITKGRRSDVIRRWSGAQKAKYTVALKTFTGGQIREIMAFTAPGLARFMMDCKSPPVEEILLAWIGEDIKCGMTDRQSRSIELARDPNKVCKGWTIAWDGWLNRWYSETGADITWGKYVETFAWYNAKVVRGEVWNGTTSYEDMKEVLDNVERDGRNVVPEELFPHISGTVPEEVYQLIDSEKWLEWKDKIAPRLEPPSEQNMQKYYEQN